MKRRFTILTAALALLAFLAIPMGMWGQTYEWVETPFSELTTSDVFVIIGTQSNTNYALSTNAANAVEVTIVNGKITSEVEEALTWKLVEVENQDEQYYLQTGTNANSYLYNKKKSNGNWDTGLAIGTKYSAGNIFTYTSYNDVNYLQVVASERYVCKYSSGTNWRAYASTNIIVTPTTFYKKQEASSNTDPEINFTPASIMLNNALVGVQTSATFSVSQANLTSGITLSVDNGSLSTSSIAQGAAATTVTWTYTPTSAGAISATVTATSVTTTETLAISGTAIAPVEGYDVDFEYATDMYPNWTFDNMTSYQTGSITAHGGTYYGTTGGKATASITTTSTVANPGTLTCYVSKQSGNTTSSTWYIQVSEDGSDWTDVESHSATSMSQGSWVEFTADLSSYSNVYVRVYYSGSTAIRNIDDLTLTVRSSVADPTFSPVSGTTFGNEGLSVTISQADNEDIYYTLDGTQPTTSSSLYSGAIALTATTTIKAIASDGTNTSNVVTATYTYVDPNAPGTVNNPYTVAQARAAIDANTGITGVYATGIVSQVDSYNNNYHSITYWISDDGTTTNQLEAYGGISGITGWTFASKDDIEVGATVVIYGNLKKFNTTYEFDVNNELVSYTAPQHAVEAPTFSPAAGTFATAQTVNLSCATTGATIYYTLDGTEPTDSSTEYTNAIAVSTTTTIKAIAYVGSETSTVATATYHINSQDNPYTVGQALAFNEYPANGIYVHGIVSTAPTQNPTSNGELTYHISVDGNATNQLEVYKGKGLNEAEFEAQDDIQVGDIVTIYGNVVIYNGTKEFSSGNYLVSFERPTTPAQEYSLTVSSLSHVNLFIFGGEESETIISTEDGETTAQVYNGTEVTVSIDVEEGYVFQSLTITDANGNPVEMEELTANEYYGFTMPASNVTITATAIVAPAATTYSLATSIESGKQYIIVGKGNSKYYAMSYNKGTNRHAVEITSDGATATVAIDNTQTNAHEFTITSLATTGYYTIQDATASGYLYAGSDSGNQLKTYDESDLDVNGEWHITINAETGVASVVADNSSNRNVMQFNAGSSSSNNQLFNCYASASQHEVYLYVKDETPVTETKTKTIVGYNTEAANGTLCWYLIASPVGDVAPANVTNMLSNSYDLFYFDHAMENEWVNYKDNTSGEGNASSHPGFGLEKGKGYLYANSKTVELEFPGSAYTTTNGRETVRLAYTNTGDGYVVDLPGWNLVGNPFAVKAYLEGNRGFYTMDMDGNFAPVTNASIESMEGIFVVANPEVEEDAVTFTTTKPAPSGKLSLNLSNGRKAVDRAIVRFDGGNQLPKLQLFGERTKLYIPVEGQDYAIVNAEEMGEMPVSFKAENNGNYTLSVNAEEVSFAYLHLIDNMTGNDVDLLQTPSYSFEAKTTDYESRFKLVFATGDNSNDDNFAFYSNGSFVINNEGNAELQVIDIMGRIVKSESINGCANVSVNGAAGVYMLRLVNGDNVKVQKVVVK